MAYEITPQKRTPHSAPNTQRGDGLDTITADQTPDDSHWQYTTNSSFVCFSPPYHRSNRKTPQSDAFRSSLKARGTQRFVRARGTCP